MDASSVSIPGGRDDGKDNPEWRIDVPMRSFQNGMQFLTVVGQ
jgi:hypothetical protein